MLFCAFGFRSSDTLNAHLPQHTLLPPFTSLKTQLFLPTLCGWRLLSLDLQFLTAELYWLAVLFELWLIVQFPLHSIYSGFGCRLNLLLTYLQVSPPYSTQLNRVSSFMASWGMISHPGSVNTACWHAIWTELSSHLFHTAEKFIPSTVQPQTQWFCFDLCMSCLRHDTDQCHRLNPRLGRPKDLDTNFCCDRLYHTCPHPGSELSPLFLTAQTK